MAGHRGDVLTALRRAIAWYQHSRLAIQSANEAMTGLGAREDEQAALHVLQRAFDAARAKGTVLTRSAIATENETVAEPRAANRRARREAAVREGERELERLRTLARTAAPGRRAAIDRDIARVNRRLEVDRLRLDLTKSLEQADASLASGELDLTQQIQALQDSTPEAAPAPAQKGAVAAKTTVVNASPPPASGAWPVVHRLLALQRARTTLGELDARTRTFAQEVEDELKNARTAVRTATRDVRALAESAVEDEAGFRARVEHVKLLATPLVPLRGEAALLDRIVADVADRQRSLDRERRDVIRELGLQMVGVVLAFLLVFVGAIVWRILAMRYISDPYRLRLALTVRNIVVSLAIVVILIFRFTSELTALVTALGFAAAGIAFALQNVILAVAGYFSMVAPNGIRVGDRVSLQGPFGYVHGEVLEIGFVRIRLRELAADTLQPTGRIVVFPNSVVFTGSFYKLPPGAHAKAA